MLKKVISSSKHFIEYDIWKQKWKFLILFLLTGLYYGVINYYIADNIWIITSIESLKYLGWIYVNIPSLHLNWVKYFLGTFWISILLWIIYYLYQRTKNFLTLIKGFLFLWITFLFYFYFWGYFFTDYNFISFLPFLVWSGIISSIFIIYLLISLSNWVYLRSSKSQLEEELENDTDKPLIFYSNPQNIDEEKINIKNIDKMKNLWYDSIAQNLAKRLKEEFKKDTSPEVIGIEWEWGSGKSSFISLVKYYVYHEEKIHFPLPKFIKESDPNKKWNIHFSWDKNRLYDFFEQKFWSDTPPTFLDFNPWYFESTTNLLDSFFRSLSEHIEEKYHIDTGSTFSKFARSIGNVSEYEIFWVKFKRSDTPSSPDYEHQRNNLNQILDSLDNPIIIIIDDLDRVSLEQCKQIFQLIYLCSDLRNVHFLVSYDSEKFNSIDVPTFDTFGKEGFQNETFYKTNDIRLYIEKIIHSKISIIPLVGWLKWLLQGYIFDVFKLPSNPQDSQRRIVENTINELFKPSLFFEIYKDYLSNPRKIRRIFNVLINIIDNEKFILRYWILKSERRFLIFIKILLVYIYHYQIFKEIFFELQSVDLSNQTIFDNIYYRKTLFLNWYRSIRDEQDIILTKKTLDSFLLNYWYNKQLLIKDLLRYDLWESSREQQFTDEDLKIVIWVVVWFYSMDDVNSEWLSIDLFEYLKQDSRLNEIVGIIKDIEKSCIYNNLSDRDKKILNHDFIINFHQKIVKQLFWYLRDYIRDVGAVSEIWILEFYSQLFTELKSSHFPIPAQWENFSDTLLGHISDNIWISVYSLIFWIEKRRWYLEMQQVDAQRIIRVLFDDAKLFDNWGIFWISYLLRLWSGLSEVKYTSLLMWETTDINNSNNTKTWIARFIYGVFEKYYIQPRKSFLTGDTIVDRYWINFVKYQFMSQKEMGDIVIADWNTSKIGERIGEYFQNIIYTDARFSDIKILFTYLVAMWYTYSDDFRTSNLHYSDQSDWNNNPYMIRILLHFQASIETYIHSNPEEKLEVNARYDGYNPKPYKISEIWEHLKKVTKLDNPSTE